MLEVIIPAGVLWIVFRGIILVRSKNNVVILIRRELLVMAFAIYCLAVIRVTIFPLHLNIGYGQRSTPSINIIPFAEMFRGFHLNHFSFAFMIRHLESNLVGNILLLLPLGFFLPTLWTKLRSFKRTLLIGILSSLSIETAQYIFAYLGLSIGRASDIDDVILNSIGVIFGYLVFQSISCGIRYFRRYGTFSRHD
jgi:glycopeptide antibiotics resistance protein